MAKPRPTKPVDMTPDERGFLDAIKKNPDDATARLAYADWLDEHERPYEAILQREQAGVAEVRYKLRRKSDGLFACGQLPWNCDTGLWSDRGKLWRKLSQLQDHIRRAHHRNKKTYGDTPWSDVEIAVVEVRPVVVAALPAISPKSTQRKSDTQAARRGGRRRWWRWW